MNKMEKGQKGFLISIMTQKRKLLIGDDKKVNRYVLSSIFEEEFDIVECQNGLEVLTALEGEKDSIAAVLLDLYMPDADGIYVLDQLQERKSCQNIPIVVVTANADDDMIRKIYSYDVADYIQKPFQEAVIKFRIERIIEKYDGIREKEAQKLA